MSPKQYWKDRVGHCATYLSPVFLTTSWYIVLIKHTIYYEYNNNYFCCKRE